MINWIIDRVWAWKNRDELAALDAQMDCLMDEGRRLEDEMEAIFGPDWREKSKKRLEEVMPSHIRMD